MGWIIGGVLLFLVGGLVSACGATVNVGDTRSLIIAGVLGLITGVYSIVIGIKRRKEKLQRKAAQKSLGVDDSVTFVHISGLPLADGAACNVMLGNGEFIFERTGTQIHLPFAKIRDVACKTETEIQNHYVSSIGGAVGGAFLFGPIGAMIGGRAKKKTDIKTERYFMIAYEKDGDTAYIAFDCNGRGRKGDKFAEAFQSQKSSIPQQITL